MAVNASWALLTRLLHLIRIILSNFLLIPRSVKYVIGCGECRSFGSLTVLVLILFLLQAS
jgi:hypothetical protein